MKKGQNAPKRKTIEETLYGIPLAGDVLNHIRLMEEWKSQIVWLASRRTPDEIKTTKKYNSELKKRVFASWEKVIDQPESLRKLALVAAKEEEMFRARQEEITGSEDEKLRKLVPAAYPDDFAILALFRMEKANGKSISYDELYKHAERFAPGMTMTTFSKKLRLLGISGDPALTKSKPGPQPGTGKLSGKRR